MNIMCKISAKKVLICSFVISITYWTYLFFFSSMSIVFDAIGYEDLGRLIHEEGWVAFFKAGPHREPFYSFLISLSMSLSDIFKIPYLYIQKIIQISLLLSTQILTLIILRKIKIHSLITAIVVLYIGISPALVNSTFSLFSEITTYPFVLGVILVSAYSWRLISKPYSSRILFAGLGLAFLFVVLTLSKSVFEYVVLVFSIPFFVVFIRNIFKQKIALSISSTVFLVVLFVGFYSCIIPYKSLNQKYNGNFVITDVRGAGVLYGATARRSQEFNLRKLQVFVASIPGDGVCRSLFNEQECFYWSFMNVDKMTGHKLGTYQAGISSLEVEEQLMLSAREEFSKNPLTNILFVGLESFKIFFWESSNIGYVEYPPFLAKLFQLSIFKNILRLSVSLLTVISVFYTLLYVLRNWSLMGQVSNQRMPVLLFCLILIVGFTGLYSLCYILTRYSFPIVPLFMICIAFFANQVIRPVFDKS